MKFEKATICCFMFLRVWSNKYIFLAITACYAITQEAIVTIDSLRALVFIKWLYGLLVHRKKKRSHFDPKSWVTGKTKIRPGIQSNWRIFKSNFNTRYWESNWLDIESQIDSILRVKLTWYWESNWLDIENQIDSILRVKLTRYWESNWLDIESQIDSILRVKLTRYWESNWLDFESQIDSISRVKLTRFRESNWLDFESQIDSISRVKLTRRESNWLDIETQIDSQYRINLTQLFFNYSVSRVEF